MAEPTEGSGNVRLKQKRKKFLHTMCVCVCFCNCHSNVKKYLGFCFRTAEWQLVSFLAKLQK